MIQLKEELAKYQPALELDDIEEAIHANPLQDMLDILQYISRSLDGMRHTEPKA